MSCLQSRQQLEPLDGVNNCGIATHPQLRTMLARGDRAAGESDRGDILDAAALQDGLTRRMKLNLRSQQPRVVAIVKSGGTSHETQVARRRQRGERFVGYKTSARYLGGGKRRGGVVGKTLCCVVEGERA